MPFWSEYTRIAFSIPELHELAVAAGFEGEDIEIAAAIAMGESSGRVHAVGDVQLADDEDEENPKWGPSIGLFQIRTLLHPEDYPFPDTRRVRSKLFNPGYNVTTAKMFKDIYGWENVWTVYRTGAYKKYLVPYNKPTGPPVPGPPVLTDPNAPGMPVPFPVPPEAPAAPTKPSAPVAPVPPIPVVPIVPLAPDKPVIPAEPVTPETEEEAKEDPNG